MHMPVRLILIFLIVLSACGIVFAEDQAPKADVTVVVEGFSACPSAAQKASCRHAALADALRRAIEKGVGIIVASDTRTKNFLLTSDAVRTSSQGYVRDYKIVDEGLDQDTYRVKIEARVAPGSPEQSVAAACLRLKDEIDPTFRIAIEGQAGVVMSSELAAYGLKVGGKKPTITISGVVKPTPEGERFGEFVTYASGAYTGLSVTDTKSGLVFASVDVELPQPVPGSSAAASDRAAIYKVCELWIHRNIPIIASALLDPGKPVDIKPSASDVGSHIGIGEAPSDAQPVSNLIPSDGPRLPIKPEDLSALARKLQDAVNAKPEFSTKPVGIAVSRFKGIGISDSASVEDVLEDLSTALVKTGVFQLVERTELDKVLRELKIQNSGLVDSATARKLGKLVGARAVLVGSISDRKDSIVINARLIDTETGLVSIAESIVIDKDIEPEPVILRAGPGR